MIRKLKVVALVLAIALVFSGCSMITKNSDRVGKQVVATVNNAPVTRNQVETYYKMQYFISSYYQDTANLSKLDDNTKTALKSAVEDVAKQTALVQKATELGYKLTDDEKSTNKAHADSLFTYIKQSIQSQVEEAAKTDKNVDVNSKVDSEYKAKLTEMGFTSDDYANLLNNAALIEKLKDYTDKQVQVTDDDVTKWYNDTLVAQQAAMDKDPTVFATDVNSNQVVTYIPEDTIAVKQVLLTYKDTDISDVAKQLYTDGDKNEAMAVLKPQIDAMTPDAHNIVSKLKSGTSIDEMIKQYGNDPDMASGGSKATTGYLVGNSTKDYIQEFKDAALKLTKVGDVSDPVTTYYGLHILQTNKVYTKGTIPFDSIKDLIKSALLPNMQNDKYSKMEDQWAKEAKITYDKDRMFN